MNKNKKIAIILLIGAVVAALSYYFLIFKPNKAAKDAAAAGGAAAPATGSSTSGSTNKPASSTSLVGKSLYAKSDNVQVVRLSGALYKYAKKDEWIGLAYDRVMLSGAPFYKVSGDNYVAEVNVYAK